MVEHKDYKKPYYRDIDNPIYRIGPCTFDFNGVVRINGVEYYEDSIDLRKAYAQARDKQKMWEKLSASV